MVCVVDTHALIWFIDGDPRLSAAARDTMDAPATRVIVPSLALAELADIHAHRRTTLALTDALSRIDDAPNCEIIALGRAVIERLPATLNIHDGIIVATALLCRERLDPDTVLITKDAEITASGLLPVLW